MTRPLGNGARDMLVAMARPTTLLLGATRFSRQLERRRLIAPTPSGNAWRITPAGLRALADLLEAGAFPLHIDSGHRK